MVDIAVCIQCNKNIPRGRRYKSEHHQQKNFCSKKCYDEYCETHPYRIVKPKVELPEPDDTKPETSSLPKSRYVPKLSPQEKVNYRKLTDYIQAKWPDPNAINWTLITKQIQRACQEYNITYEDIRLTLKFAIEYEENDVDGRYGITQFIPRFLDPMFEFMESINKVKEMAETLEDDEIVHVSPKRKIKRYWKENVDF